MVPVISLDYEGAEDYIKKEDKHVCNEERTRAHEQGIRWQDIPEHLMI
jgi:hypothetical protein